MGLLSESLFISQSAVIGVFGEGFDKIKVKVKKHHFEKAGMILDNENIDSDKEQ